MHSSLLPIPPFPPPSANFTGGYADGDFNGDGVVNADDFALFTLGISEYQSATASVPEPTTAAIAAVGGLFLTRRRRRK